ncbi:hypothetical protein A2526_03010 [candidate division WOR-1 bacterium RIFOXYD2_FULL_36_8]|uniref:Uncharacterized protein n=1 Tax=candidate division WOR-1 bacterium RIFOXYB2_FULL_36_35 TaxID=1802578 RepID=A0A1F4S5S2_UNCSA|nr:MAG: hypothetical protein A2230_05125 [candidate division WOR-1 bacterium RIFOXYA2_FULL_36_21]OGC15786.1 MAG: hypothetical protein A2290_05550 [candidate division WOR-1 bacterium RIFOXYB2_FULL_36_35]OGC16695.1 MAG: hypothetical protein A2282_06020 [candidate division WOR-1 bacterium RIFOXYA12_FULL_36_13]OGC39296.1 MAG: hypothetical protein A2526_03010 [candidate division WOR-1 bacterium RIFOXYD2_FULL_36_8]
MSAKKIKAQMRVFQEMESQLLMQADRVGVRDDFMPSRLKEMEYDSLKKHILSFYAERSNLEYEMQMFGVDKKEVLIKMEKLEVYIRRAERLRELYDKYFQKSSEKQNKDKSIIEKSISKNKISVSIGDD